MRGQCLLTAEVMREAHGQFEAYLHEFFARHQERYAYGDWVESLYLDVADNVARKGKRIRPMLLLGSHGLFAADGEFLADPAMRVAVGMELLHAFILIHDDVIDRSERRRGIPTFHKHVEGRLGNRVGRERVGQSIALVVGDIVFALAVECVATAGLPDHRRHTALRQFLSLATETGCGEIQEISLGLRDISRVSADEIRRMYALKTTRHTIEGPLALGAMMAGASGDAIQAIRDFAEPVGLAFQIANDLQEFRHFDASDPMFQSDLLEGKKTLLAQEAFERLNECDKSFLQLCMDSPSLGEPAIHKVGELIQKSGAEAVLEAETERLFNQARVALDNPALTPQQREGLLFLKDHVRSQASP
jgi:geranylgeranyl diphosphate synthase, type I